MRPKIANKSQKPDRGRRLTNGRNNDGAGATRIVLASPPTKSMAAVHTAMVEDASEDYNSLHRALLRNGSRTFAPLAILGGTASVYASAIRRTSNESLTPLSLLYLLLLAANYAFVPRMSKRYIHPRTNKRSVALVEEAVKMAMGWGGFVAASMARDADLSSTVGGDGSGIGGESLLAETLRNWTPRASLLAAGVPSALYALQGVLTYAAHQNLDPVSFNGLTQFKVLSAALCCYVVLGKGQSRTQMVALGLLMLSTAVFQGTVGSWREVLDWKFRLSMPKRETVAGGKNRDRATKKESNKGGGRGFIAAVATSSPIAGATDTGASGTEKNSNRILYGVLPCLGATVLSGLAGALSQRSLQVAQRLAGGSIIHRDPYFYTVEISFCSAVCLLASMGMERWRDVGNENKKGDSIRKTTPFFEHWTWATLAPVIARAMAGVLTALVHQHLGSVVKGFALVLGLVFSALFQFALDGRDLTSGQLMGTALVLLSSWMHFTS